MPATHGNYQLNRGRGFSVAVSGQVVDCTEANGGRVPATEIVAVNTHATLWVELTMNGEAAGAGASVFVPPNGAPVTLRGRFFEVRATAASGSPVISLFLSYGHGS